MQAHQKLNSVYGDGRLSQRQYRNWFARFRAGNFVIKDDPKGRPIFEKKLMTIFKKSHIASRDIHTELNMNHKTVLNHLHRTGFRMS